MTLIASCVLLCVAAVLAWSCPANKPRAVLGYLSFVEFWFAVFSTGAALSVLVILAVRPSFRRAVGFRLAALWLGTGLALCLGEAIAWLLPARHQMDNPWYFAAGGGLSESVELPFERPPHLRWEGLSRGDLALLNQDEDPYARLVSFRTDRQGFRNGEEIEQADVVVIGDSFSEAGNVAEEETFAKLIGRKLNLRTRNLGRAGYSPPTELIVLRKYGLDCRPKIVVWQIAEANDLDEAFRFQEWVAAGRTRFFDADSDRRWRRGQAWQQRSPTYRVFEWLRRKDARPWPYDGRFRDRAGVEHPMRFLNASELQRSVHDHPGWPALADALAGGAALCQSNRIQLVVLHLPTKDRVMGPYTQLPNRASSVTASPAPVTGATFSALLKIVCDTLGVTFVDATPQLDDGAKTGELVYLPFDTHLSPRGHEIVAEVVAEKLKSAESERQRQAEGQ